MKIYNCYLRCRELQKIKKREMHRKTFSGFILRGFFSKSKKYEASKILISSVPDVSVHQSRSLFKEEFKCLEFYYKWHLDFSIKIFFLNFFCILSRRPAEALRIKSVIEFCYWYSCADKMRSSGVKEIQIYGYAYDPSWIYLCASAKHLGVKTLHWINTGFLNYCGPTYADKLVYRTRYQARYHNKNKEWTQFGTAVVDNEGAIARRPRSIKVVGIYPSGFYARSSKQVKEKYFKAGVESESVMISWLCKAAEKYKRIEFRLYIHRHGGIENDISAKDHYGTLLNNENVVLMPASIPSIETFHEVDVAFTCVSEIFFDRIERGQAAFLLSCFEREFISMSELNDYSLTSYEKLETLLGEQSDEF